MANMLTAVQKYAVFSGRARRQEYWLFVLFSTLVGVAATAVDTALGLSDVGGNGPVSLIESLALLVPTLAVGWRRMHDVDKPGWYSLLPVVGFIPLAVFLIVAVAGGSGGGSLREMLAGAGVGAIISGLVTVALVIYVFVLTVTDGTPTTNRFGPDPKGRGVTEELAEVFR